MRFITIKVGCRDLQKGPQVRRSGMKEKFPLKTFPLWGNMYLHSQQFQMMCNRWIKRQMSWQRTERALLFFSFLKTTTVTQVTGKSERIPVFWLCFFTYGRFCIYVFYFGSARYYFGILRVTPFFMGSEQASGPRITFS